MFLDRLCVHVVKGQSNKYISIEYRDNGDGKDFMV